MALAHGKMATEKELSEAERTRHQVEARRRYEEAIEQIDGAGAGGDTTSRAIRDFRREAADLLEVHVKPQ